VRAEQRVDILGAPWVAETIGLTPDDEGPVVATLVSRRAERPTGRAVLHVHGFADYFFQTEYAEWWTERGYDFYALDLRKYGRSLRPHQTPNYITDLRDYFEEIDEAWRRVTERDGHTEVVFSAHSTGGLLFGLWANERQPKALVGAVMNSPWLDLQGSSVLRLVSRPALKAIAARQPRREIKRNVTGHYGRSLHRDYGGEWDFELLWKPVESFTVYAAWLLAIRAGHAELQRGLDVRCPVLVLSSGRSTMPQVMGEDVHSTDIVLDVGQIRRWSTAYGQHVTYLAIQGARHDIVLSRAEPRHAAYDAISAWMSAWVDPPRSLL